MEMLVVKSVNEKFQVHNRKGSAEKKSAKERDDKLKVARECQNDERQSKIEELKAQAEGSQRYRKQRDLEKRSQVEERKKAIMDAEKERREYILRKNQERGSRIEVKKREKNSFGYAFGSSTPRLMEPFDFSMLSPSTFWGQRRCTSVSDVVGDSLSRRSSERKLNDSASKKRATSAGDIGRHNGSSSGTVMPSGHLNNSRLGSAMFTSPTMSTSSMINRRSVPVARKPRPSSIAGTGDSLEDINKLKRENNLPVALSPNKLPQTTPKYSANMMSTSLIVTSSSSRLCSAENKTHIKRDPLTSKATTPKRLSKTASSDHLNKLSKGKYKDLMTKSAITPPVANRTIAKEPMKGKEEKKAINQIKTELVTKTSKQHNVQNEVVDLMTPQQVASVTSQHEEKTHEGTEKAISELEQAISQKPKSRSGSREGSIARELAPLTSDSNDAMTASMFAKSKITTEEEAKAALRERRRLAREEAERQRERLAKLKKQEEAERQRRFEQEDLRLAGEHRKAEEERMRQVIEEAKQNEKEKQKREEEENQQTKSEEAEKKAKEDSETQRIEVAERLKREGKEREERRKRVEAIMSRTRRAGPNTTRKSTPTKENYNSPGETTLSTVAAAVTNTTEAFSEGVAINSNSDIKLKSPPLPLTIRIN